MRPWLALLALAACDSAGGGFGWSVVFEGDLGTTAVGVDLSIVPGGCSSVSPAVYTATVGRSGMSTRPDALEPGTYGFRAVARNASCETYAEGCVEATFEDGVKPEDVITSLSAVAAVALCPIDECVDGTCQGLMPDGGVDAPLIDTGVDASCDPDLRVCAGDDLQTCVAGSVQTTACALGCGGDPADCLQLIPSNVGEMVDFAEGEGDVTIDAIWLFDTATGEIRELADPGDGGLEVRPAGEGPHAGTGISYRALPAMGDAPPMGVFVMNSLMVPSGTTLAGSGTHSLVLLVDGDVSIAGTIDVAASSATPAWTSPGGAAGAEGLLSGEALVGEGPGAGGLGGGDNPDGGGGGGGLGSTGGNGGGLDPGIGGVVVGNISLVPLVAGSGGGGGGTPGGGGGRGAGALQISARGSLSVSGTINACGQGGEGGQIRMQTDMMTGEVTILTGGGGGGGSGGSVLLEALDVSIDGIISANGGGGGQGSVTDDSQADGADGDPAVVPAPSTGGSNEGASGSGLDGVAGTGGTDGEGGGGGGGAGRIRINTPLGIESFANTSPNTASGLTTVGPVERG